MTLTKNRRGGGAMALPGRTFIPVRCPGLSPLFATATKIDLAALKTKILEYERGRDPFSCMVVRQRRMKSLTKTAGCVPQIAILEGGGLKGVRPTSKRSTF